MKICFGSCAIRTRVWALSIFPCFFVSNEVRYYTSLIHFSAFFHPCFAHETNVSVPEKKFVFCVNIAGGNSICNKNCKTGECILLVRYAEFAVTSFHLTVNHKSSNSRRCIQSNKWIERDYRRLISRFIFQSVSKLTLSKNSSRQDVLECRYLLDKSSTSHV